MEACPGRAMADGLDRHDSHGAHEIATIAVSYDWATGLISNVVNPATAPPELDVPSIDVRRERRKK